MTNADSAAIVCAGKKKPIPMRLGIYPNTPHGRACLSANNWEPLLAYGRDILRHTKLKRLDQVGVTQSG